jgi:hypothetical protein
VAELEAAVTAEKLRSQELQASLQAAEQELAAKEAEVHRQSALNQQHMERLRQMEALASRLTGMLRQKK